MSQNSLTSMKTPVKRCRRRLLPYDEPVKCGQNTAPVTQGNGNIWANVDELLRAPRCEQRRRRLRPINLMEGTVRRLFAEDEPSNRDRNAGIGTPERGHIRVNDKIVRAPRHGPSQQTIESQVFTPVNLMK
jgi:hypothetical protein